MLPQQKEKNTASLVRAIKRFLQTRLSFLGNEFKYMFLIPLHSFAHFGERMYDALVCYVKLRS